MPIHVWWSPNPQIGFTLVSLSMVVSIRGSGASVFGFGACDMDRQPTTRLDADSVAIYNHVYIYCICFSNHSCHSYAHRPWHRMPQSAVLQ